MKQLRLTILLTILMSMVGVKTYPHDFAVANEDDVTIYYTKTSSTNVAVSYCGSDFNSVSNEYSGNVVIPKSVTYNGTTYSVTSIAYAAFEYCSSLTSVTIPNSVTSIGRYAFSYIENLSSISIPASVTNIGDYAFIFCSGLTSINVESGNPKYDSRNNCNAIIETSSNTLIAGCQNTVIPNSVTTIGVDAFAGCSGLTSIIIPNSVTSIEDQAFWHCTSLTSITIPKSVTSMSNYAFPYSALTSVTIPSNATYITDFSFDMCYSLTSVKIEVLDYSTFCNNELIQKLFHRIKNFHLIDTEGNEIKEYFIPEDVTTIGDYAFYNCTGLTSIDIPNSVTNIGSSSFVGCSSLTSISIPASVTSIGAYTFRDCSGLTSIDIPNSLTSIGESAFFECGNLRSVSIPYSVMTIGNFAFCECIHLTSVTVNTKTPLSIGPSTFSNRMNAMLYVPYGCKAAYETANYWKEFKEIVEIVPSSPAIEFADANVKAICVANWDTNGDGELSEAEAATVTSLEEVFKYKTIITSFDELRFFTGLTYIDSEAFAGCWSLTSVTIPNSVESIGDFAFNSCIGLTSIKIPDNVTFIGGNAFLGCVSLISITIPNSVTYIYGNAFFGCNNLLSIIVDSENTEYDSRDNSNAIIETSSNTLIIGCKKTVIPNSVTTIGESAFAGSGLTSIIIPNSVTTIGGGAFQDCSNLTSVTVDIETPLPINSDYTFTNAANSTLYVPYGCKAAYEAANYWKEFKEIVEITPPSPVIEFADAKVKAICVANWDANGDGELSEAEAEAVTSLGSAFRANKTIRTFDELKFFTSLTNLKGAFSYCDGLTLVTIPNSVTTIGEEAFYGCNNLASITIPNSVTTIGGDAFRACENLASITIGNGVKSIGERAFSWCRGGIASIVVSSDNKTFDSRDGCNAIISSDANTLLVGCKNTVIPNSVTSIGDHAFLGCYGLTTIIIPNSVTIIGDWAFTGCHDLSSVSIPNSVTSIGDHAFYGYNKLTSIIIPNSVTSIGSDAFGLCDDLTSVTVDNKTPLFIDSSIFSSRKNATLYVPYGCKSTYEAANYWKEFKEIVEMPAETNSHLAIDGKYICKGGKVNLPVLMENEEEITAFQFDVEVPEDITITDVQLGDRRSNSHTVDFNKQADGTYRVMGVSLLKIPFSGNEGELVSLMLSAEKNIESDGYNIGIKNIVLTTSSKEKIYPEDVSGILTVLNFEQGDADGDGSVDVADVVAMIDYILDSSASDIVFLAADMNADGEIDIFDVMIAINIVLKRENSAGSRTRASGNTEERAIVTATADGTRLGVNDASRFTAFQFDVEVGDGMQLTDARLNGNAGNHEMYSMNIGQNTYRVIGVSMDNSTLTASGDDLVELSFSKGGCAQISNIVFVTPQKSKVCFACGNGEVTGIGRIRYEQAEEIFDLSGRKVNSDRSRLPKGVYIINNKKVVIK